MLSAGGVRAPARRPAPARLDGGAEVKARRLLAATEDVRGRAVAAVAFADRRRRWANATGSARSEAARSAAARSAAAAMRHAAAATSDIPARWARRGAGVVRLWLWVVTRRHVAAARWHAWRAYRTAGAAW